MLSMVAHTCNPSTQEVETGDYEFKVSLRYTLKPCLKKIWSRDVARW
jgi:hypothetical protein